MHKNEEYKENRLNEKLKKLEKDLTLKELMVQAKKQLWANIIESVNDIWPSIQVIHEQKLLIKAAGEAIQKLNKNLVRSQKRLMKSLSFLIPKISKN